MTEELEAANARWEGFMKMMARSTCSACDRAEYGWQMAQVRKKIDSLTEKFQLYEKNS